MSQRKHIFTAGPAVLPESVLLALAEGVRELDGSGQSILELSHRSDEFEAILARADASIRRLVGMKSGDKVLFVQGGASTQFSMVPMNLRPAGQSADYILTGTWSEKALEEAKRAGGQAKVAASSKEAKYGHIPESCSVDPKAAYLHYTSNNTIYGTQFKAMPGAAGRPLVCDASSDFLSRPISMPDHALIYAGAQKNAGPSGVTIVLIREDCYADIEKRRDKTLPTMLDYVTHGAANSLYNTPPTFAIFAVALVAEWIESLGGLTAMAAINERKAKKLYDTIDELPHFNGVARADSRSLMNVCFRLAEPKLEDEFIAQAEAAGCVGLKGHRSVGGLRASLYNALPESSVSVLCDVMRDFDRKHG